MPHGFYESGFNLLKYRTWDKTSDDHLLSFRNVLSIVRTMRIYQLQYLVWAENKYSFVRFDCNAICIFYEYYSVWGGNSYSPIFFTNSLKYTQWERPKGPWFFSNLEAMTLGAHLTINDLQVPWHQGWEDRLIKKLLLSLISTKWCCFVSIRAGMSVLQKQILRLNLKSS